MSRMTKKAFRRKPISHRLLGLTAALGLFLIAGCASPSSINTASTPPTSNPSNAGSVFVTLPLDDTSTEWEFVPWLRAGGVKVEKNADGDDIIFDSPACRTILVRYRRMLHVRLNVIAENVANVNTTHDAQRTKHPYRRQFVVTDASGGFQIAFDPSPFVMRYDPGNPDAQSNGYVQSPNVDPAIEQVNAIQASRSYRVVTRILKQFDPTFLDTSGDEQPETQTLAPVAQTVSDSAQEQTLSRIIERFPGVISARVKIKPKQLRIEQSDPPTATVFLTTNASDDQSKILAAAAARTVANAVAGLTTENVSVITNGVASNGLESSAR